MRIEIELWVGAASSGADRRRSGPRGGSPRRRSRPGRAAACSPGWVGGRERHDRHRRALRRPAASWPAASSSSPSSSRRQTSQRSTPSSSIVSADRPLQELVHAPFPRARPGRGRGRPSAGGRRRGARARARCARSRRRGRRRASAIPSISIGVVAMSTGISRPSARRAPSSICRWARPSPGSSTSRRSTAADGGLEMVGEDQRRRAPGRARASARGRTALGGLVPVDDRPGAVDDRDARRAIPRAA